MPFKSKSQQRFMFAAEERGDVPKGTAEEWAHKTKDIKALPEHVKHKKSASEIAEAALKTSSAVRDFFNGGSWAPGGVEYEGPMKIAGEIPTSLTHSTPTAVNQYGAGSSKTSKMKKTARQIADAVIARCSR